MAKKKVICQCGSGIGGYMFQGRLVCDECLYPDAREEYDGDHLPELPDSEYREMASVAFLSGSRTSGCLARTAELADSVDNASAKKLGDAIQQKFYELGFEKRKRYNAWPYANRRDNGK